MAKKKGYPNKVLVVIQFIRHAHSLRKNFDRLVLSTKFEIYVIKIIHWIHIENKIPTI
jgi:hypothetical protein